MDFYSQREKKFICNQIPQITAWIPSAQNQQLIYYNNKYYIQGLHPVKGPIMIPVKGPYL